MRDSLLYANGTRRSVTSDCWLSEIKSGGYRAVIFDCDGTLVDSSDAHFRSFQSALRAQGHDLDRDWYLSRTGLDRHSTLQAFAMTTPKPLDIMLAAQQSIADFIVNGTAVHPITETAILVDELSLDFALAVGTNAEIEVAQASLRATNLLQYFDFILSVSDGFAPKPAPDIFSNAANRLGFSTAQTLVVEDSPQGVDAALTAGLDVIHLI